jgi:uridine kinase
VGIERYADLAARIMAAPPRLGSVRVVAVDGPAGSGKTTFAGRLAGALRECGAVVGEFHTDDILDGWTDLHSYWPRLQTWVLEPLSRGEPGRYRAYDWIARHFTEEWQPVPVPDVLLLEGVASARSEVAARLSLSVFVLAGRDVRLARGVARDGEALRPEWLRWMADEDMHYAVDGTAERADVLVNGAPTVVHQADTEFVGLPSAGAQETIRE